MFLLFWCLPLLQDEWPGCTGHRPPVGRDRRRAGEAVGRERAKLATGPSPHAETRSRADQDHLPVRKQPSSNSCYVTDCRVIKLIVCGFFLKYFQGYSPAVRGHPGPVCSSEGLGSKHRAWEGDHPSGHLGSLGNAHSYSSVVKMGGEICCSCMHLKAQVANYFFAFPQVSRCKPLTCPGWTKGVLVTAALAAAVTLSLHCGWSVTLREP